MLQKYWGDRRTDSSKLVSVHRLLLNINRVTPLLTATAVTANYRMTAKTGSRTARTVLVEETKNEDSTNRQITLFPPPSGVETGKDDSTWV